MKKISIIALALLAGLSAGAQALDKINPAGLTLLEQYKQNPALLPADLIAAPISRGGAPTVPVLVRTTSPELLDSLRDEGYEVEYISRSVSLVNMPIDKIENLADSREVMSLSFGNKVEPAMNEARKSGKVSNVQSGIGLIYGDDPVHPFKGTGVIVAAFDTGFDPAQVNFYNSDQTASRLKYYARFGNSTTPTVYTDNAQSAPTDNSEESHGTHVMGIAAGAYKGPGVTYVADASDEALPFYGVAPEADIAMSAGQLYTTSILSGIRRMITFAEEEGKPIAINLSVGGVTGPRDGSETDVVALNEIAEETPICIASGNEADIDFHVGGFTVEPDAPLRAVFTRRVSGTGEVWGADSKRFVVSIIIVDRTTGEIVGRRSSVHAKSVVVGGNDTAEDNEIFTQYCSGSLNMRASTSMINNRYNIAITNASLAMRTSYNRDYYLGIEVTVTEPERIDVWTNANSTFAYCDLDGFSQPNPNGSISSMACGENTICIGAYNTRYQWKNISDKLYDYGNPSYDVNKIAPYSSYGTLLDGRNLPDLCAPGTGIISSYNNQYVSKYLSSVRTDMCATASFDGTTQYFGIMQGTSMACPFATGVVGLMLEAYNELTPAQICEILTGTADSQGEDVQWGAGKIDAFAAVKKVIAEYVNKSGINNVAPDFSAAMLVNKNGEKSFEVTVAAADKVEAALYSTTGQLVATAAASGSTVTVDATAAAPGIYILRANNHSQKVIIR